MPTHDDYVNLLKSTLQSAVTKSTVAALVTLLPWLSWPPIYWMVQKIVAKIVSIIIYETEMAAFFKYTDLRVAKQGREFIDAALANAAIQKTGTPEQKAVSEMALIGKLREFVKLKN